MINEPADRYGYISNPIKVAWYKFIFRFFHKEQTPVLRKIPYRLPNGELNPEWENAQFETVVLHSRNNFKIDL